MVKGQGVILCNFLPPPPPRRKSEQRAEVKGAEWGRGSNRARCKNLPVPAHPRIFSLEFGLERKGGNPPESGSVHTQLPRASPSFPESWLLGWGAGAPRAGKISPWGKVRSFGFHLPGTSREVRGILAALVPVRPGVALPTQTRIHQSPGPHFSRNKTKQAIKGSRFQWKRRRRFMVPRITHTLIIPGFS